MQHQTKEQRPFGEGLEEPVAAVVEAVKPKAKRGRPRKVFTTEPEEAAPEAKTLAAVLPELAKDRPGLTAALAENLSSDLPPPQTEVVTSPEREPVRHADRFTRKPAMQPVPVGFIDTYVNSAAGIRVNKSMERDIVAIQFDNDRPPTRGEKDILEAIHEPDAERRDKIRFEYDTAQKQWTRPDREQPGANLLDAKRLAQELVESRTEGRGR
jgi:hypothetical protein